jgi:PhnB protein
VAKLFDDFCAEVISLSEFMSNKVKAIPDNYSRVSPYLFVRDGGKALEFYAKIFGAKERMRMPGPGGKVMHSEFEFGDSVMMLADEIPQMGHLSPESLGGTPVIIGLYVENVDEVYARAVAAGAKPMRPVENQFYGDRAGSLTDPFGHVWHLASHIEDMSPEEMQRRAEAMFKKGNGG